MAAGISRSVAPRGNPHRARTCCSNWLVTAASIVKCPELCGRGAISLTMSRPSAVRKNSTVKTPTVPSAWAVARASVARFLRDDGPDRRGHERRVQDMPLVAVKRDRIADGAAIGAAGHDDRDLRGKVDPSLGNTRRPGPGWPTHRARRPHVSTRTCPLPS